MSHLGNVRVTAVFMALLLMGALVATACTGPAGSPGASGLSGNPGLPGNPGEPGKAGLPGVQGVQGVQGIQGIQGIQGVQGAVGPVGNIAGFMLDKEAYVVGVDRGLKITAWGFQPDEAVLFTLNMPTIQNVIIAGGDANGGGVVEAATGSRTRLDRLPNLEPGMGSIVAEGSLGSKGSALIVFVADEK